MMDVQMWLVATLAVLSTWGSATTATSRPNVVLFLTDDQAWNGTSVQMDPRVPGSKSDYYQTPRLEELAAQGMRFSQGYASGPVCDPTRAAIQTGKSPAQLHLTELPQSLPPGSLRWRAGYENLPLTPPAPVPFDPDQYTLPRAIKDIDPAYRAGLFGKWHLDVPANTTATASGYDEYVLPTFNGFIEANPDPWAVFYATDLANDFMQRSVDNNAPFFLQVSYNAVHAPVYYRPETKQKYDALPAGSVHSDPKYAAMTEDLDTAMGEVLDKLDQLGISDNTYVIYVSDNGAPRSLTSSAPLKHGKASLSEGGVRIPYIIKGPGIAAGSVSHVPVTTTDLYSTIAAIVGRQDPLPDEVEGANLLPVLENGGQLPAGMDHLERNFHAGGELYWHWPMNTGIASSFRGKPSSAVRDGDFKLYLEHAENGGSDTLFLYNLATDIGEKVNLAAAMPEKVAELRAKLYTYLESVDASFAYDVKQDVVMQWDASQPGANSSYWRTSNDLRDFSRETWELSGGVQTPQRLPIEPYQAGLPQEAFVFDGNDHMRRLFFQVGDDAPRRDTVNPGTPDWDRSATLEFWVRLDSLTASQVLFESGDGSGGISATLGDGDGDGQADDLRFRILGLTGPNGGENGTLQSLTVTTKIDRFADPTKDFVHLAAVFNDDPGNRYAEIYVNGALAARTNGVLGIEQSLQWDGYDDAGLGNVGGNGLGASGGAGALPFSGGFRGELAMMRFYNHALNPAIVQTNYNAMLAPASAGIRSVAGDAMVPNERPTSVALGRSESSQLMVVHERDDILSDAVMSDAIVRGTTVLSAPSQAAPGVIPAGAHFSSYLLQFDPLGTAPGDESVVGSVEFSGRILAILFDPAAMSATDAVFGTIGDYGSSLARGFTPGANGFLGVSGDRHTLSFGLTTPGTELVQFRVLTTAPGVADFNGDGLVSSVDLPIWEAAYGVDDRGDADGDGDTDGVDFLKWQQQFVNYSADFDGSGVVDGIDLARWEANYGVDDGGDATGDGVTDGRDFLAWQRQFNGGTGMATATAVPEPTTGMLLALIATIMNTRAVQRGQFAKLPGCNK